MSVRCGVTDMPKNSRNRNGYFLSDETASAADPIAVVHRGRGGREPVLQPAAAARDRAHVQSRQRTRGPGLDRVAARLRGGPALLRSARRYHRAAEADRGAADLRVDLARRG